MTKHSSLTTHHSSVPFYVTGGTLSRDALSYVMRQADDDLFTGLVQGQFCYVLTSRQMGKSSLMVRTAARLREAGAGVVLLDLTAIGQNLTAEQWYNGLLTQMGQQLELEDELEEFWDAHPKLGPLQRWMRAISRVLLPRYPGPVAIFVDEIDAVRSLPFSTDSGFVRATNALEFFWRLQRAEWGAVIEVESETPIELPPVALNIPAGVTVRGSRRGLAPGAELYWSDEVDHHRLAIEGDYVRITGLRFRGPSRSTDDDLPWSLGIQVNEKFFRASSSGDLALHSRRYPSRSLDAQARKKSSASVRSAVSSNGFCAAEAPVEAEGADFSVLHFSVRRKTQKSSKRAFPLAISASIPASIGERGKGRRADSSWRHQ